MEQKPTFEPEKWISWVQEHENESVSELALRYAGQRNLPLKALLAQVKGRQIARLKLPTFYAHPGILYPDTLILEQCSSEEAADQKTHWSNDKVVADLTGGLGIDTLAFSKTAKKVIYCEPDAVRCAAARHNFSILNIGNVEIQEGTAEETTQHLLDKTDIFYLDPSRRKEDGRKVFRIEDLSPNILELKERLLSRGATVLIKLAPMLDIREGLRQLPETMRVEVISRKDECRELLFHLSSSNDLPVVSCIDTGHPENTFTFQPEKEKTLPLPIGEPEKYLFEPNAAIRKAGPWRSLCEKFGLKMLHPNSHLFTGPQIKDNFPGRTFIIDEVLPYKKEKIQEVLAGHSAQLVFYNFPVKPQDVSKTLKIKSGEPNYLFFTATESRRSVVLFTKRIK